MADETLYGCAFQVVNENYAYNEDPEKMRSAIRHLAQLTEPQRIGKHLLALDMEDNAVPYYLMTKLLHALNAVQEE